MTGHYQSAARANCPTIFRESSAFLRTLSTLPSDSVTITDVIWKITEAQTQGGQGHPLRPDGITVRSTMSLSAGSIL